MTGSLMIEAAVEQAATGGAARSAYARTGGAATVRRIVVGFHRLVFGDRDLLRYFGADPGELCWHQAAQLTRVLGGPDWYRAAGVSAVYLPLVVPAMLHHRSAFNLVRAVDAESGSREVVLLIASALAAGRCRIIGGFPVPGVLVSPAVMSVEGPW